MPEVIPTKAIGRQIRKVPIIIIEPGRSIVFRRTSRQSSR